MSGVIEYGKCEVCGRKEMNLQRKYYHYNINCDCHRGQHFEFVRHCADCKPSSPEKTTVTMKPVDD